MRSRERGAAMIIALLVVSSLMTVGLLGAYLTMSETKSTGLAIDGKASLYCAEAGLTKARGIVGSSVGTWSSLLDGDPSNDPSWYPIRGDLDIPADGVDDFEVTVRDNDDEPVNLTNDPTHDNDMRIYLVSRCTRFPESPREVVELIYYSGGGNLYRNQAGQGAGNTGNSN